MKTFKLADALLFDGVEQPWRADAEATAYINPIVSMMCADEIAFLRWAAERFHQPGHRIVDMGPLAGGSTRALAAGVVAAEPNARAVVHSYDLWRYCEGHAAFYRHPNRSHDASTVDLWRANLGDYAHLTEAHPGDLATHAWPGDPISILFLDAAKSPALMAHVANEFAPALSIGGLFVQQDYVSAVHPWIHVAHELLMDHFEIADSPGGGTVNFICTKQVPRGALQRDYFSDPMAVCAHLARAAERLCGWERLCVLLSGAYYSLMRGDFDDAEATLQSVRAHADYYAPAVDADADCIQAFLETRARPSLAA